MQLLRRPLLLEGEAGVGKTEVAKALAAVHATELIRLQCYEGLDQSAALYEWNYQRQLLAIQAHRGDEADAIEDQIFSEKYLLERPLLAAIRRSQAAGAADRRDRPRRRRVRGVPARTIVGLPGLDPRTRHDFRDHDPACGADLERHPRTVRRAAPPLPLPLCRLSRRRSRGPHHHGADRRRRRVAVAADRAAWSKASARRSCARCPASPRRWTGRRRWSGSSVRDLHEAPETVHETLMCLLKTHEDKSRVTREVTARLLGKVA